MCLYTFRRKSPAKWRASERVRGGGRARERKREGEEVREKEGEEERERERERDIHRVNFSHQMCFEVND